MHFANAEEIRLAELLATTLHREFDRKMDKSAGAGQWSKPSDAENACMQAEADVLGWLHLAKEGKALRSPLRECVLSVSRKIQSWSWPIPSAIAAFTDERAQFAPPQLPLFSKEEPTHG